MQQLTFDELFKPNGNLTPCPYTENCQTYGVGCGGESWWCNQKGISKKEPKETPKCFDDYIGRCEYCDRGKDKTTCQWSTENKSRHSYNTCENGSFWHPDDWKIPKLCGGCKYHNSFVHEGDDYYHPIEEPNIYCTRDEGSVNRQKPFARFEQAGFGVGTWHRQHEWDTCEAWEPSEYFKEYNPEWSEQCRGITRD